MAAMVTAIYRPNAIAYIIVYSRSGSFTTIVVIDWAESMIIKTLTRIFAMKIPMMFDYCLSFLYFFSINHLTLIR
jgi:hypothetical protein